MHPRRPLGWSLAGLAAVACLAVSGATGGAVARPAGETDGIRLARTVPAYSAAPVPVQWCGGDQAATDRTPDLLGGNQVHVIYAIPSDGQDQFGAYVHRIVTDLGAIDAWWRRQDPVKAPRFDRAPFTPCASPFGQIDVSSVRLPRGGSFYALLDTRIQALAADLAPVFSDPSKKYLVYYDGPLSPPLEVCGTAFRGPNDRGGPGSVAAVWLRACGAVPDVGAGDVQAAVAAHELLHQLGVLPAGARNPCFRDDGHPCDSNTDLMFPSLSQTFESLQLDVGRDDYYAHQGSWFDAQDSRWLMRADVPPTALTVTVRGRRAEDRVASDPAGIECPPACSALFDTATQVRLTATPGTGSRFQGWGGACTGRAVCVVTTDTAKTVEATFAPSQYRLVLSVTGSGRALVPGLGVVCAARCTIPVDADALVRVRAAPTRGWRFLRWTGSCRGRGVCTVRATQNRTIGATFQRIRR